MDRWQFFYETTDRIRWPNRWGTVVILADTYMEGFYTAYAMLYCRRDVEIVTRLDLVL